MYTTGDQRFRSKSRKTKRTHKNRKQFRNFMFSSARCSLLRAEGRKNTSKRAKRNYGDYEKQLFVTMLKNSVCNFFGFC
jgi:hypothetical protein